MTTLKQKNQDMSELIERLRARKRMVNMKGEFHSWGDPTNPDGPEAAETLQSQQAEIERKTKALDLACRILGDMEPPDSRAVSNEFVAMFSVLCGKENDDCMEIIQKAIDEHEARTLLEDS